MVNRYGISQTTWKWK